MSSDGVRSVVMAEPKPQGDQHEAAEHRIARDPPDDRDDPDGRQGEEEQPEHDADDPVQDEDQLSANRPPEADGGDDLEDAGHDGPAPDHVDEEDGGHP